MSYEFKKRKGEDGKMSGGEEDKNPE